MATKTVTVLMVVLKAVVDYGEDGANDKIETMTITEKFKTMMKVKRSIIMKITTVMVLIIL
jgi:hypothetical protein